MQIIGESGMLGSAIKRLSPVSGVYMAAGRVGGIQANMAHPADFISENLDIYIRSIRDYEGEKTIFFGSSCMYPRQCRQPMREEDLWTGKLEPTNEAYAVAKLAGEVFTRSYRRQYGCRFITAILCNLYGPGDHYELERAHVIPALIRRFTEARRDNLPEVKLMGTGAALREFMHVDDAARAAVFLMEHYDEERPINTGTGEEIRIDELAWLIADLVGYRGSFVFEGGEDGMPRKCLDSSRIRDMGWEPKIGLKEGLERTIAQVRL